MCGPAQASEVDFHLSSLHTSSSHHSITNTVFLPLPVGVSDFECSLTNKPKPSKLIPSLPLEPSDHVSQGQRYLYQKKERPSQLLRAGPVKVRHKPS